MKQLFPPEIIEFTLQKHWEKRHTKSKIIYFIILVTLLITIISLPFIYIDVTSQSRGTIKAKYENNTILAGVYGEIRRIDIFENKKVIVGDTLIWLKTDEIDQQIKRNKQKLLENIEFIEDINVLLNGKTIFSTPKYSREYSHFLAKISEITESLIQAQKEFDISKKLYHKGVESKFDYEQNESKYKVIESQLALCKKQQYSTWQSEISSLENENNDLRSELIQLDKKRKQYIITAPISGSIVQFSGFQSGNFLSGGQEIAIISSEDSLIMECYISPKDIGYIYAGQDVRFQMDAFNYQQWGLVKGSVEEIIHDVIQVNENSYFKVKCSLKKNYLELENGYKGKVKKGMSATVRFHLTRRSLAQLLFDKIDQWINPKIITDEN